MRETLKLPGEADALHGDGLDAGARTRDFFERYAESGEDAPALLSLLNEQDEERVLDLAP